MGIVAAFDKVLYFNPASQYTVLRMKTADMMIPDAARSPYRYRDHLIRFAASGYGLPQTDAVKIEIDGEWEDGKYGYQLKVQHWREVVPPTIEGVRAYLASGLLKGIGSKTAEGIVQRFGVQSLHVLEHTPEKLLEIRGITEEKLEEIKAGYAESKVMRDLLAILAPFKVTPNTAMKIYQHFGPGGVELIRESPYRLCQVPGFGFRRVDAIVQKSGGSLHDPMRVQGALIYALEKSRNEKGHLYLEAEVLIQTALQLLNDTILQPPMRLSRKQVENELEKMIMSDVVVSNKGNIYLPHVYRQELETAYKAVQILSAAPKPVELMPVIERVKGQLGIALSDKQLEGVKMVFRHNLSIITGGPGTGKSTVLKAVTQAYRILYPKGEMRLGAPTGKASRRMAETTGIATAQTLHSLLHLRGDDGDWQGRKRNQELNADFVIVDEASMMDMWLASQLFKRLRPGTKVLLVGDADQLESVGAGDVFHELIASGIVPVTKLDEIFRQAKDSPIPYNARYINEGSSDLCYSREYFQFIPAATQEEAADLVCGIYQEEAEKVGVDQVQVLSPFRARGEASSDNLNEAIRQKVNPYTETTEEVTCGGKTFRLLDKVMQTKNNGSINLYDKNGEVVSSGVFNGETGRIRTIRPGRITVDFDGRYAGYSLDAAAELDLSYATTIHKALGSEYDTVIIPLLAAHKILLTRNLLYTAVTRAKRRVVLVGQKKALFMAISASRKGKRNTLLGERIRLYWQERAHTDSRNDLKVKRAS